VSLPAPDSPDSSCLPLLHCKSGKEMEEEKKTSKDGMLMPDHHSQTELLS
jgi:hypothetical protein